MKLKNSIQMKANIKLWVRHKGIRKVLCYCKYIPYRIYAKKYDKRQMISNYVDAINEYKTDDYSFYYPQGISVYGKWLIPRKCLDHFDFLFFEGEKFKVPSDYDIYLTKAYGDYMTLPSESQRENRHLVLEIKL